MRFTLSFATLTSLVALSLAGPLHDDKQQPLLRPDRTLTALEGIETGVGHFSQWSRETKRQFLIDWQQGRSSEWILVQGNEGGDMDSMTAALTWAYHLQHSTQNDTRPIKAIALLQTPADGLDLRPENKVALDNSLMSSGHSDLLTINELPSDPQILAMDIKGIVVVDHAVPLRKWSNAPVLSIFDHHVDQGAAPDAKPRVFEPVASCTTLVARQMLDEFEQLPEEYHLPHELLELILGAIAIDSSGLEDATPEDRKAAKRVLKRSNWNKMDLDEKMKELDNELSAAKNDLDNLGVRDLLRRDWKGDLVDTPSPRTPTVSVGFSSIPYSLDEQIEKTGFKELFDWFAIEAAWTAQVGADVSVALNKYSTVDKHGEKQKHREIVLCVRSDVRINNDQADKLFRIVVHAIESDKTLKVKPWHRVAELGWREMVWTHKREDAGRKYIRPLVEAAIEAWEESS